MNCTLALAVLAAALGGACDVPPPRVEFYLSQGPAQACPASVCDGIPLTCESYLSIRVVDPERPSTAYISQCEEITSNAKKSLCALAGIDIDTTELPYKTLEVQFAVFPATMVTMDENGNPRCPSGTEYDSADGFPIGTSTSPQPGVGGRAYYRPGDEVIDVTLGCADLELLAKDTCEGIATVRARATVDDFDTHVSVGRAESDRLSVAVGEPRPADPNVVLNPGDVTPLSRTSADPPAWAGDIDHLFESSACATVLDDTPQSTTAVRCRNVRLTDDDLGITGVRLTKASLDRILSAIGLSAVPFEGLTIGIVLDDGVPVGGQTVSAPEATIQYLNADRSAIGGPTTAGGPNGGVFVSRDALYPTLFSTSRFVVSTTQLGGRISNKVTIVVLDVGTEVEPGN